jgi:CheY-like chemotaxis protein
MKRLRSVLDVDDNPFDNEIHRLALVRAGAVNDASRVFEVLGGEEGLELLRRGIEERLPHHPPSVVLVDINMPGMTGFEFVERLRPWLEESGVSSVVMLMLSSSVRVEDRARAEELGLDGYVRKPLTRAQAQQLAEEWGDEEIS